MTGRTDPREYVELYDKISRVLSDDLDARAAARNKPDMVEFIDLTVQADVLAGLLEATILSVPDRTAREMLRIRVENIRAGLVKRDDERANT